MLRKIIIISIVLVIIIAFKTISGTVFYWNSADEIKFKNEYNCKYFGQNCPNPNLTPRFQLPDIMSLAGCRHLGVWIKKFNIKFTFFKQCMI